MFSEEFGLIGNVILLTLYALLIACGLMIAANAATLFSRLLAAQLHLLNYQPGPATLRIYGSVL